MFSFTFYSCLKNRCNLINLSVYPRIAPFSYVENAENITDCQEISWCYKIAICLFSGHYKSHKQTHLCGKLEELSDNERHIYFPSSHTRPFMYLQGGPIFSISYRFVDYCYNVTFTTRNGSYELKPNGDLQCTFKIFLPYGYRVAIKLKIGDNTTLGELFLSNIYFFKFILGID